ncbi:hypothetical protein BC832DRAFT_559608 [Gaertneriomyces semiglobifer]|nr:hypothetical protein BC832DRAFT_559608 [Gaertneriomyces semiglobifer]
MCSSRGLDASEREEYSSGYLRVSLSDAFIGVGYAIGHCGIQPLVQIVLAILLLGHPEVQIITSVLPLRLRIRLLPMRFHAANGPYIIPFTQPEPVGQAH